MYYYYIHNIYNKMKKLKYHVKLEIRIDLVSNIACSIIVLPSYNNDGAKP